MSRLTGPPGGTAGNPYLVTRRERPQLRELVIRMFLVMLPGQLVGYLLGILVAVATGAFAVPNGGLVVSGLTAATTGLAVGLATTPPPRLRPAGAAISAILGAAVAAAVIMVAMSRLAAGYTPGLLDAAPGVIITAVGQGVIGWLIWMIKARA